MIRKSMPSGYDPMGDTGFPSRQTRNAFARRSCSNKKIERDDDSKKSHHGLVVPKETTGSPAQAARTELRNLPTSSLRRFESRDRDCAAERTCEEAEP